MKFIAQISDGTMVCHLTPEENLPPSTLCTSGMGPMECRSGQAVIKTLGSYIELSLPAISANETYKFILAYPDFKPANRAWLPMGAYLRLENGEIIKLPQLNLGCTPQEIPKAPDLSGLKMLPEPSSWKKEDGLCDISLLASDNVFLLQASKLSERVFSAALLSPNGIKIDVEQTDMPEDAYQMTISSDSIKIQAGSDGGVFYAGVSLAMLKQHHQNRLPCGVIYDEPKFAWRGQHLDCARHFYSIETIKKLLDLMATLKLNRFHWHFADDEAFRLQIECYPELWQKTEWRGEGHLLPAIFSSGPQYGGSYSKDDVRELIAYAKGLNIEIMPEVEFPAHALSIAKVFPETRDPDDTGGEVSVQGYVENVINPAMEATWEIFSRITKECIDLFPLGIIHLGCDELPEQTWMGSPLAKELMGEYNLLSIQDLQSYAIERLASITSENGAQPAAWEEAARGKNCGIQNDAILFSWTGAKPGFNAALAGYKIVMCPAQHTYMDMAHTSDPNDWGASWAAFVSLADTINWDTIPKDRPELADNIMGVQGAFWSEFTTEDEQMWPMLIPRIFGIAAKAWQSQDITQEALYAHANILCQSLEANPSYAINVRKA